MISLCPCLGAITLDHIGLFVMLAGFVIGLGAVTVIDLHGFLGRKSAYWNEATIRTHKITKPLIWIGVLFAAVGGTLLYWGQAISGPVLYHAMFLVVLVLNGLFLTFSVSPMLLQREKAGKARELLPKKWQQKITLSFIVSFVGWWGALAVLVHYLVSR